MNSNVKGAVIAVSSICVFMLITMLLTTSNRSYYKRRQNKMYHKHKK